MKSQSKDTKEAEEALHGTLPLFTSTLEFGDVMWFVAGTHPPELVLGLCVGHDNYGRVMLAAIDSGFLHWRYYPFHGCRVWWDSVEERWRLSREVAS